MRFTIKLFNPDIIDCSSCPHAIFPDPESLEVLMEILQKICESDVVAKIGYFSFWINRGQIYFDCPNVTGTDLDSLEDYDLRMSDQDEANKISGLVVLKEEEKEKRSNGFTTRIRVVPGLEGIMTVIKFIKSMLHDNFDTLPNYFPQIRIKSVEFSLSIIWGMDKDRYIEDDGTYMYIGGEREYIKGEYYNTGSSFTFGNEGGDSFEIFNSPRYINHLNKIQKILDDVVPGKYEPGPEEEYFGMLNCGIFNREGRKFVSTDKETFSKAIGRYGDYKAEKAGNEILRLKIQKAETRVLIEKILNKKKNEEDE